MDMNMELALVRTGHRDYSEWRAKKKVYKTTIKAAKKEEQDKFVRELNGVKNVSEGWKFIKRHSQRVTQTNKRPAKEDFVRHFTELLQGDEVAIQETEPSPRLSEFIVH